MSNECNYYPLTEDESQSGLLSIICGDDNYEKEPNLIDEGIEEIILPELSKEQKEVSKLISGLDENRHIKEAVIKKKYLDFLNKDIQNYIRREKLPTTYINIVIQKNALEIILRSFLKNECYFTLDTIIITRIKELSMSIHKNIDFLIVYDRVARVQKFVHNLIQEKYSKGSHLQLNKVKMKNLLSVCRLHLEFYDVRYKNIDYLLKQESLKKEIAHYDYVKPVRPKLLPTQKYVPRWKYNNSHIISPFSNFTSIKKIVYKIEQINIIMA